MQVADVVVVGGGPAGSTAAALLAERGRSVVLFEKEQFPRNHVGGSLLPFCYSLFERLGVLEQVKQTFVRKPGARFTSPNGATYTDWCFGHIIHDDSALSFHVDRGCFDHLLLKNAKRLGANVHQQTAVRSLSLTEHDGSVLVNAIGRDGYKHQVRAHYLIDASGRSSIVASQAKQKQADKSLARTAIWGQWSGVAEMRGAVGNGMLVVCYLGGERKGWLWMFPIDRETLSIGAVMSNDYLRSQKRRFIAAGVANWQEALYREEVAQSAFIMASIDNATLDDLTIEADYSYTVKTKMGDNFALIGDAGRFIDPIFSSGVYLAMKSASLVADALHQTLDSDFETRKEKLSAVYDTMDSAYELVYRLVQSFYDPQAISLAELGNAPPNIDYLAYQNAMAVGHYLLAGDFFEESAKYHEFIDLLHDPEMFEGYRQYVVQRKDFLAPCELPREPIFPPVRLTQST